MRLIDLDALLRYPFRINRYRQTIESTGDANMHFAYGVESVIEYAKSLPTVEAKMTEQDIELQRLRAEIAELEAELKEALFREREFCWAYRAWFAEAQAQEKRAERAEEKLAEARRILKDDYEIEV